MLPLVCVALGDLRKEEGTGRLSLRTGVSFVLCLDRAALLRHGKCLLSQPQHDLDPTGEADNDMEGVGSFIKTT